MTPGAYMGKPRQGPVERAAQGRRASEWHRWASNLGRLSPGPSTRAASDNAHGDDSAKNIPLRRLMALWPSGAHLADGAGVGAWHMVGTEQRLLPSASCPPILFLSVSLCSERLTLSRSMPAAWRRVQGAAPTASFVGF